MCGSTVRVPRSQPPAYGQLEGVGAVQQRAEEHDDRAGTPGRGLVDRAQVELLGRDDLEVVVVVEPAGVHADAGEHLEQPVDLLDPGDLAQRGRPRLSSEAQSRATPAFFEVFTSIEPDSVVGPVTRRWVGPGAEGDDLGVERLADPGEHLQGEVLVALLDPVDRALAGVEALGELLLGPARGACGRRGSGCRCGPCSRRS